MLSVNQIKGLSVSFLLPRNYRINTHIFLGRTIKFNKFCFLAVRCNFFRILVKKLECELNYRLFCENLCM